MSERWSFLVFKIVPVKRSHNIILKCKWFTKVFECFILSSFIRGRGKRFYTKKCSSHHITYSLVGTNTYMFAKLHQLPFIISISLVFLIIKFLFSLSLSLSLTCVYHRGGLGGGRNAGPGFKGKTWYFIIATMYSDSI